MPVYEVHDTSAYTVVHHPEENRPQGEPIAGRRGGPAA
ncbi:hypothetical protein ABH926_002729 [Catenulispora sp. GP43]